jgi:hypothetical protein
MDIYLVLRPGEAPTIETAKYLFGNGNVSVFGVSGKINYSDAHHLTVSASKGLALPFFKFATKNKLIP